MKTLLTFLITITTSLLTFAQGNKPEKGFGLGYGISFLNTPSHAVRFTHWTKKNIEYGAELQFNYSKKNGIVNDSVQLFTFEGFKKLERKTTTKESAYQVNLNPIFLYHLTTKNNLDLFFGAIVPIGIGRSKFYTLEETSGREFLNSSELTQSSPFTINTGVFFTAGCNYFFYQNLSLGASFRLGYSAQITDGNTESYSVVIQSGQINPNNGTSINNNNSSVNITNSNFGFTGSALFTLSYYFSRNKEGKTKE